MIPAPIWQAANPENDLIYPDYLIYPVNMNALMGTALRLNDQFSAQVGADTPIALLDLRVKDMLLVAQLLSIFDDSAFQEAAR